MEARQGALFLLEAVLDRHQRLEAALTAMPVREARDRGFAHLIAATVLRRLGTLDAVLEAYLRGATPPRVRHVLRIGAAQSLFLGTAPHAAVGETVGLVRRISPPHAGLANAVLRRVAAEGASRLEGLDAARLDAPDWLWSAWWSAYGTATYDIARAHASEPPLDLSPAPGATPPEGATVLPWGSWRMPAGADIGALDFDAGTFWVQDSAASFPARLLAARPAERVIDLCAAPGGKTIQLLHAGAAVTAVERDPLRMKTLAANLARLTLSAETVVADATTWRPAALADAVLLDAPCTATGTIRRHPDVAHLKRPTDVATVTPLQDSLIDAARAMLRPGGRMIYAVCSLQREEGIARVEAALRRGWRRAPFTPEELATLPEARTDAGDFRTLPHFRGGMDGFFAARLTLVDA
jgi:16S rRNA (cytosine967-C5)-methyltransferase